ncbi:hypothetical protein LNO81_19840 [Klebsiella variicola subsp. variicola]|nr:hypothetical protein [Klebsiella variicola subsp. variicola]
MIIPLQKQDQRQRVIPAGQGAKHKQQTDRRQARGAGDQHPTVSKAVDHLDHDPLHAHAAEHHQDHHQPGVKGEKPRPICRNTGVINGSMPLPMRPAKLPPRPREKVRLRNRLRLNSARALPLGVPQVQQQGGEADGHQPRQPA